MTVVAVFSQTLRQKEAAKFLSHVDAERKTVITQFKGTLDAGLFPGDTDFLEWSADSRLTPSASAASFMSRVRKWVREGSRLGLRIERWLRSAEWRLRYLDRLVTVVESRRNDGWDFDNTELIGILESCFLDDAEGEVVVFDLFDLPAVLKFAEGRSYRVIVR